MSVFFLFGIHRECFVNRFSSFGSVPRVDNQCSVQRVSYKVTKQIRCDGKGRKREDEKTYQLQRILKGSRLREFLVDKQCTRRRPIRNTQSQLQAQTSKESEKRERMRLTKFIPSLVEVIKQASETLYRADNSVKGIERCMK